MRACTALALALFLFEPRHASAATTELVSVAMGGGPADGATTSATMTPDGHWVAFTSRASNLVTGDTNVFCDLDDDPDDDNCPDIFVRDRQTSMTTRVSVDSFGVEGNQESRSPDISADGRWVAFESLASNLVAGDTNNAYDCFLHDRDTGSTERVSITSSEGQASGTHCGVSDDGRFVVFNSGSNALHDSPYLDVYIRDRQEGTTTLISYWGFFLGENDCDYGDNVLPSISGDGRFVMFMHDDFYECDPEHREKRVIIFDRENEVWETVPLSLDKVWNAGPIDFARFFTYRLFPEPDFTGALRLFLRDRDLGKTEEIGLSSDGTRGDGDSFGGRVTSDGRFVAFTSEAPDLVPGDTNVCNFYYSCDDVFLRDREAKTTERVSLTADGGEGDGDSNALGIADGGAAVLFLSKATNLVAGDINGLQDLFVRAAVCGDGVVDRGEECDDGNLASGDGCSATCLLDCPPLPRMDCLAPLQSGKATIKLADRALSTKDLLQWKWAPGVTAKTAFGHPTTTDGYRLCVYHGGGLALTVGIPAGAGWKESPTSFKYKNKSGLPDGIARVMLKEGVAGKAKIQIKGMGASLPMPALMTLASPLTVQLSNTLAVPACWEAVYTAPFQRQDAMQLKDKAD